VEDATGPYFGIIASIQHSMPCNGKPSTTVEITFVRETYRLDGKVRTPPIPIWLNSMFSPSSISTTYADLLGMDDKYDPTATGALRSAMVDPGVITSALVSGSAVNADGIPQQCDMDSIASSVIPVPKYSADITTNYGLSTNTIADKFRTLPTEIRDKAFLQYQFRTGMTLSQYCSFHSLAGTPTSDAATASLPLNLAGTASPVAQGDPLFAYPSSLIFTPPSSAAAASPGAIPISGGGQTYGYYTTSGTPFMPNRQNAALLIRAAIDRRITFA
jgi:hypothetical protein